MRKQVFEQVISLGSSCRAKHHIQKVYGKHISRRGVFDWQVTPIDAVVEYLKRDFVGLFERDDLEVRDGHVWNSRFNVMHMHEFPKGVTVQMLDELYLTARDNHDRWCARTRALIANDLSTLFVFCLPIADGDIHNVRIIEQHFARLNPRKRFKLLLPPDEEFGADWIGDADLWQRHLSEFIVRPPLAIRSRSQLYRWQVNMKYLLPKRLRPAS